jgi:putative ABC transport system substrate-binding protein
MALAGATLALTAPLPGFAQRKMPVLGVLGEGFPEDPAIALNLKMLRRGLKQEGFVEGETVQIEYRWARQQPQLLPKLAAELVALPVDVLVNEGGTGTAVVAKHATSTIPIVFHSADAIDDGLVDDLARPRGNLTGVSQFSTETLAKATELLIELVPTATTITLLSTGQAPLVTDRVKRDIQKANATAKVDFRALTATNDTEFEQTYASLASSRGAVVVFANVSYVDKLVTLAGRYRVPAAYNQRAYVTAGGLMSYGASIPAAYVIKGVYAGKILKGARPGDLPVQRASKFELAINLKTARALRLDVPPSLLARADEVID